MKIKELKHNDLVVITIQPKNNPVLFGDKKRSPTEKFLFDIFSNIKPYYSDKYLDSIFYKKDNEVLFEYDKKSGYFWCHYDKIWKVLDSKYGLNYREIRDLIKGVIWESLKLNEVTPSYDYMFWDILNDLKLKGL